MTTGCENNQFAPEFHGRLLKHYGFGVFREGGYGGGGDFLDSHMLTLMGHLHMSRSFFLESEFDKIP